jgi:glucuronokinase
VTVPALRAEARARGGPGDIDPPSQLVEATVGRFARFFTGDAAHIGVQWKTSVPRGVGLGGSSAIVISTLSALCGLYRVTLAPTQLASFALEVETEELQIAAGLQDRVAQAYGGLTFMDFGGDRHYETLPPRLLPPLLIAWRPDAAQDSDHVHSSLRARFERGDGGVKRAMAELAQLARAARGALKAGDDQRFADAVDGSFEIRRRVLALEERHLEMVDRARALGASANYTGSGGAIVAVCRDQRHLDAVSSGLRQISCETLPVLIEGD